MKLWKGFFSSMKGFFLFSDEGFDTICLREQMNATWTTLRLFSPWHFVPIFFVVSMEWSLCLRRFWHAQKSHDLCWHYAMQLTPKNRFELIIWNAKKYQGQPFFFPISEGSTLCRCHPCPEAAPLNFLRLVEKNMLPTENFGGSCPSRGCGWLIPLLKFWIPRFVAAVASWHFPNCQPSGVSAGRLRQVALTSLRILGGFGSAICLSLRFRSHGCSFQGARFVPIW